MTWTLYVKLIANYYYFTFEKCDYLIVIIKVRYLLT